jgi:hypothetical protein
MRRLAGKILFYFIFLDCPSAENTNARRRLKSGCPLLAVHKSPDRDGIHTVYRDVFLGLTQTR